MPVDRKFHPCVGDSEKIAKITDMEFRVWFTYIMAADDFGVLPMVAPKVKAGDRSLSNRTAKQIDRALQTLVDVGLVRLFEHQGARYIWSANWQEHQEIRYPRREQTHYPAPPEADLRALDGESERSTRELFATFHTKVSASLREGFGDKDAMAKIAERERKRCDTKPRRSRDIPGTFPEHSGDVPTLTRARAPETANGLRLTASDSSSEGVQGEPFASDVALRELQAEYPQARVTYGGRTEHAFWAAIADDPAGCVALMRVNLENHKRSHEWRVKGMVPAFEKWLRDGLWRRTMSESPPAAEQLTTKNLRSMQGAAAFIAGGHS